MNFDLKTPCKNCPFRTDETGIRFACKDRAREIAEQAYRQGFPCHLSAVLLEETEYDDGGYVPGENTQHCAGAIMMFMKDQNDSWPGVDNDEDLVERLWDQMDWDAPVFESEEDFVQASTLREEMK